MMIEENMQYLQYTYQHRKAFAYMVEKLVKDPIDLAEMRNREKNHDMDKMVMYTVMDKKEASRLHRATSFHHLTNGHKKTYYDLLEAVIDFECAALTKADKPLNAYDTVCEYGPKEYPLYMDSLMQIMDGLDIRKSYVVTPDDNFERFMAPFLPADRRAVLSDISAYFLCQSVFSFVPADNG